MDSYFNKAEEQQQKRLENNSLLYIVKRAADEWGMGTWEDTTAAYNYIAKRMGMKQRTTDGLKYAHKFLRKNETYMKVVEEDIKKAKWVEEKSTVEEFLRKGLPSVRQTSLDRKPS
jgi:hypothetical protein